MAPGTLLRYSVFSFSLGRATYHLQMMLPAMFHNAGVPVGIVWVTPNRLFAAIVTLPVKLQLDVPELIVQVAAVLE